MRIYTSEGTELFQISKAIEVPQYVEGIPYSLQQKLGIGKTACITIYKGFPLVIKSCFKQFYGDQANQIIKVLNGYQKSMIKYNRY